jgi:hypothetical protein
LKPKKPNRTEPKPKKPSQTEKTEPKQKNGAKPEKNRARSKNRVKPVFVLKNRTEPKPVGLNWFWFFK